jgi:hypothetical protein
MAEREVQRRLAAILAADVARYGWHDAVPFFAGGPFQRHVCESVMIGAITGKPVELVDRETVTLQVPATAEIVVAGYIDPDSKLERKIAKRWKEYGFAIDYLDDDAREQLALETTARKMPEV